MQEIKEYIEINIGIFFYGSAFYRIFELFLQSTRTDKTIHQNTGFLLNPRDLIFPSPIRARTGPGFDLKTPQKPQNAHRGN
jgi:hypothetical protein